MRRNTEASGAALPLLQSGSKQAAVLADDLSALRAGTSESAARWTSRPAVLRRVAMMFADRVPAESTRLIASGEDGTVLATAVALTTGLPFAIFEQGTLTFGEAHAGEDVALVAIDDVDLEPLIAWCKQNGVLVRSGQSVFGARRGSLFIVDGNGHIAEGGVA
jgi:hypothetical protein